MGRDVINLTEDDYKKKKFKAAPAGTYVVRISNKSKIAKMRSGNGLKVQATIIKGPHKKINFFDNIAGHVGWKIAQLLSALGAKKMTITLQQLLKLIEGKELRAIIRVRKFDGKDRNEVVQWLPLAPGKDEDDEDLDALDEDETDDTDTDDEEDDDESDDSDDDESDDEDDEDDDAEDEDDDSDDDDDDDESDEDDDADDDEDDDDSDDDDVAEDDDEDVSEDEDEEEEAPRARKGKDKSSKAKEAPTKRAAKKTAAPVKTPAKKAPVKKTASKKK